MFSFDDACHQLAVASVDSRIKIFDADTVSLAALGPLLPEI